MAVSLAAGSTGVANDMPGRIRAEESRGSAIMREDFGSGPIRKSPGVITGKSRVTTAGHRHSDADFAAPLPAVEQVAADDLSEAPARVSSTPGRTQVRTATAVARSVESGTVPEGRSGQSAGDMAAADESEFNSRVDRIVRGEPVSAGEQSLGDWWQTRTQRMLHQGRRLRGVQVEWVEVNPVEATRNFVQEHTLPDEVEFVQDVYDVNPITRESPVSYQSTSEVDVTEQSAAASTGPKVQTDIRSIQPTLAYAMKNIEQSTLPAEFDDKLDKGEYVPRSSRPVVLQWAPTNFYHYPLYFEDPALERYGHTYHPIVQPFASSGRFAAQLVGLPYQMALHPACSHEYPLGRYRPGDCAPKLHYQIPFNEEATLVEAAFLAGLIIALP